MISDITGNKINAKVNDLFRREKWEEARRLLLRERDKDPTNHWVLTQLGVTFYEQRRYEESFALFRASRKIVPDCPLTLWNLAGTLDALGKHASALRIYTSILQSDQSPVDDPCWESVDWADALKADCVYRLGVCFQHSGKKRKAEFCYRQFLGLLSLGIESIYSIEDVKRQLREMQGAGRTRAVESEVRKTVHATLAGSGLELSKR